MIVIERLLRRAPAVAEPCTYQVGAVRCGAAATRRYLPGWRCAAHTPAALAGRAEVVPDPERTLAGLRERAGLPADYAPPIGTSALIDRRAVASGKRAAGRQARSS